MGSRIRVLVEFEVSHGQGQLRLCRVHVARAQRGVVYAVCLLQQSCGLEEILITAPP
jgi:hypothetical protein